MQSRRIQNLFLIRRSSFDYSEFDVVSGFELGECVFNCWTSDRSFSGFRRLLAVAINDLSNSALSNHRDFDGNMYDDGRWNLSDRLPRGSDRKQSYHRSQREQCKAERYPNRQQESFHAKTQRWTQRCKDKAEARLKFFSLCLRVS